MAESLRGKERGDQMTETCGTHVVRFRYFPYRPCRRRKSADTPPRILGSLAAMAAAIVAAGKLSSSTTCIDTSKADCRRRVRLFLHSNPAAFGGISSLCAPNRGNRIVFRSCRSEEKEIEPREEKKRKGGLYLLKSLIVKVTGSRSEYEGRYKMAVEKAEAVFFAVSILCDGNFR